MFTSVIIAGIACFAMGSLMGESKETTNQETTENTFGSYEYIRKNLREFYYNNSDCREIEWRLRTDSDFKYEVQKNMRRGDNFQDAVECVMKQYR